MDRVYWSNWLYGCYRCRWYCNDDGGDRVDWLHGAHRVDWLHGANWLYGSDGLDGVDRAYWIRWP